MASVEELTNRLSSLNVETFFSLVETSTRDRLIEKIATEFLGQPKPASIVDRNHPFFTRCKNTLASIQADLRWPLNDQCFENMCRLACGDLNLPVILLQNPTITQFKSYETMLEETPTLKHIEEKLSKEWKLKLDNVVVIDIFPFLTCKEINKMTLEKKERVTRAVFDITIDFLRTFRPHIIISCQCASVTDHEDNRFSYFKDDFSRSLGSSMARAKSGAVNIIEIGSALIHVVQAFHPGVFTGRWKRPKKEEQWLEIMYDVFQPCSTWFHRRSNLEEKSRPAMSIDLSRTDAVTPPCTELDKLVDDQEPSGDQQESKAMQRKPRQLNQRHVVDPSGALEAEGSEHAHQTIVSPPPSGRKPIRDAAQNKKPSKAPEKPPKKSSGSGSPSEVQQQGTRSDSSVLPKKIPPAKSRRTTQRRSCTNTDAHEQQSPTSASTTAAPRFEQVPPVTPTRTPRSKSAVSPPPSLLRSASSRDASSPLTPLDAPFSALDIGAAKYLLFDKAVQAETNAGTNSPSAYKVMPGSYPSDSDDDMVACRVR